MGEYNWFLNLNLSHEFSKTAEEEGADKYMYVDVEVKVSSETAIRTSDGKERKVSDEVTYGPVNVQFVIPMHCVLGDQKTCREYIVGCLVESKYVGIDTATCHSLVGQILRYVRDNDLHSKDKTFEIKGSSSEIFRHVYEATTATAAAGELKKEVVQCPHDEFCDFFAKVTF